MFDRTLDRTLVEDQLAEKEWEHRYAHALLRPKNLYFLWDENESSTLKPELAITFGNHVAVFVLTKFKQFNPPKFGYILLEVKKAKQQ